MQQTPETAAQSSRPRRVRTWLLCLRRGVRRVVAVVSLLLLLLGLTGQIVRDRWGAFALMMSNPRLPVGVAAVCQDLLWRGRALPRVRSGLGALGMIAAMVSAATLWAFGQPSAGARQ